METDAIDSKSAEPTTTVVAPAAKRRRRQLALESSQTQGPPSSEGAVPQGRRRRVMSPVTTTGEGTSEWHSETGQRGKKRLGALLSAWMGLEACDDDVCMADETVELAMECLMHYGYISADAGPKVEEVRLRVLCLADRIISAKVRKRQNEKATIDVSDK